MEVWVLSCQEVAEKGRGAGRGRRGGLVDGSDKPVGDARLAGEEDVLLASEKAIERQGDSRRRRRREPPARGGTWPG